MVKVKKKRTKGTVSRRRRRQQRERIITTAIAAASCLFVSYCILGIFRRDNSDRGGGIGSGGRITHEAFQKKLQERVSGAEKKRGNKPAAKQGGGKVHMRQVIENPEDDPDAAEMVEQIISAKANLVNIGIGPHSSIDDTSYHGIIAEFCPINFALQKAHPPELPMFRDVVEKSHCGKDSKHTIKVDLKEAVELTRQFDSDNADNLPIVLDLKGVVFHESRCGSTLAANSMLALNPEKNRVYSESPPPIAALRACGEDYADCSVEASANLLKDVIYMMGRSNDSKEENLFFKFQSATTRNLETFREAFPTTPWIYLYREPIEVLMSQLDIPAPMSRAICVRSKNSSPMIRDFIDESEYDFKDLGDEDFCAIHLATLCESALRNLEDADGLGMAVNYNPDLVHDFLETIFPIHFHTPVDKTGIDRVVEISGTYSKNRGQHPKGEFKPDSEEKERKASQEIKSAAKDFLQPSFNKLQKSVYNIRPGEAGDDDEGDD